MKHDWAQYRIDEMVEKAENVGQFDNYDDLTSLSFGLLWAMGKVGPQNTSMKGHDDDV